MAKVLLEERREDRPLWYVATAAIEPEEGSVELLAVVVRLIISAKELAARLKASERRGDGRVSQTNMKWEISTVHVFDSELETSHPDVIDNLWTNDAEIWDDCYGRR